MQYFDNEAKAWKPLSSTMPLIEATRCHCAASAGNNLYVAGFEWGVGHYIYRYNTEGNVWEKHPHFRGKINNLCIIEDMVYAISSNCNQVPQRYSFATCQWQQFAKVSVNSNRGSRFYCSGATALHSKMYVLYGSVKMDSGGNWCMQNAGLHCFDPARNEWQVKATTCKPHFGSSLLVVNSQLYVAGGNVYIDENGSEGGNPAPVEGYDEENNTWYVVEQKHIPPNNLGAVEIGGRVYFIINKFPVDSGIRMAPGELYPVHLGGWENLAKTGTDTVLCYLPVKRESLKTE